MDIYFGTNRFFSGTLYELLAGSSGTIFSSRSSPGTHPSAYKIFSEGKTAEYEENPDYLFGGGINPTGGSTGKYWWNYQYTYRNPPSDTSLQGHCVLTYEAEIIEENIPEANTSTSIMGANSSGFCVSRKMKFLGSGQGYDYFLKIYFEGSNIANLEFPPTKNPTINLAVGTDVRSDYITVLPSGSDYPKDFHIFYKNLSSFARSVTNIPISASHGDNFVYGTYGGSVETFWQGQKTGDYGPGENGAPIRSVNLESHGDYCKVGYSGSESHWPALLHKGQKIFSVLEWENQYSFCDGFMYRTYQADGQNRIEIFDGDKIYDGAYSYFNCCGNRLIVREFGRETELLVFDRNYGKMKFNSFFSRVL